MMRILQFIIFLLITFSGFSQEIDVIGKFSDGEGTEISIKKDSTFSIKIIDPNQGCLVSYEIIEGKWKYQNQYLNLNPFERLKDITNITVLDTLNSDSLYFEIIGFGDKEPIPFSNIIFKSNGNIKKGITTDFTGIGKANKLQFDSIEVSYIGYEPFKVENLNPQGNYYKILMVHISDQFDKNVMLEPKSSFKLKNVSSTLKGRRFFRIDG